MQRRRVLVGVCAVLVVLAGCSALPISNASISNPEVRLDSDAGPFLAFNYSVNDYATVLLEGPSGQVINEARLEPDKNVDGVLMGTPHGGTYRLVVRMDGDTVASLERTFDGPEARIASVESSWTRASLDEVTYTVSNEGDLPLLVRNTSVSVRGEEMSGLPSNDWVPAESSRTFTFEPFTLDLTSPEEGGEIMGQIEVSTSDGTVSGEFSHHVEPPDIVLMSVSPDWQAGQLMAVEYTIRNAGELAGSFQTSVRVDGEHIGDREGDLEPGDSATYVFDPRFGTQALYTVESGGQYTVEVIVSGPSDSETQTSTTEFSGPELDITVQDSYFFETFGSDTFDLYELVYTVRNGGDIGARYDRVRISIDGKTYTDQLLIGGELGPEASQQHTLFITEDFDVGPGTHRIEIQLLNGGQVVGSDSGQVTAG